MDRKVECMWNGVIVRATRTVERATYDDPGCDVIEDHTFEFGSPPIALPAALEEWILGQDDAMEEIDESLRANDEVTR